nr:hypothetical protein [Microbispora sp. GKU 823]
MRLASAPYRRATATVPAPTIGQVQMPAGPPELSTVPYVVNRPVVIEMKENATAKDSNDFSVRENCWAYPAWEMAASA